MCTYIVFVCSKNLNSVYRSTEFKHDDDDKNESEFNSIYRSMKILFV